MDKNRKKTKDEQIAESVIRDAKRFKAIMEQNLKAQLMESMGPQFKSALANSILEMDDDEDDEKEILHDEDDVNENYDEVNEDDDAVLSDDDLRDLESALNEEETEEESYEEEVVDESAASDAVADDLSEASDEEVDDDFLKELESFLNEEEDIVDDELDALDDMDSGEEEEEEVLSEGAEGDDSYSDKAAPSDLEKFEKTQSKNSGKKANEGAEGDDSYSDKAAPSDLEKFENGLVAENRRLKEAINKLHKSLRESILDEAKTSEFSRIVRTHNLTESAKIRVLNAIDAAKNEKQLKEISAALTKALPRKEKARVNEAKKFAKGKASSAKAPKKAVNEGRVNNTTPKFEAWAQRAAELADIRDFKTN
jgi:hypothetical protein